MVGGSWHFGLIRRLLRATLEGAHSFARFWRQISSFSRHFLETLTETGSIHWVGVQTWLWSSHEETWLQSTHEGKRWWPPRRGSFVVPLFKGNLLLFVPLFGNTYRDGFNTLGRLRSTHKGKRWWPPRGGSFLVPLLEGNLLLFAPLFGNTYRDGFYTLGRCTNLVAKHPWRWTFSIISYLKVSLRKLHVSHHSNVSRVVNS